VAQIALPLDWPVADRDEDFLISDSNRAAFEHLKRWSVWPVMATLLTGPRKSGRSLLGRLFVRKTGGRLFDNAEDHDEEAIFHAWNEAQLSRRPLLVVADSPPPFWQVSLPDLRSRLAATPHVALGEPDDRLIGDLIVKRLGDRGIAVPPRPGGLVTSPPHDGRDGAQGARGVRHDQEGEKPRLNGDDCNRRRRGAAARAQRALCQPRAELAGVQPASPRGGVE
jgi:hypothetical protein